MTRLGVVLAFICRFILIEWPYEGSHGWFVYPGQWAGGIGIGGWKTSFPVSLYSPLTISVQSKLSQISTYTGIRGIQIKLTKLVDINIEKGMKGMRHLSQPVRYHMEKRIWTPRIRREEG